MRILGKLICRIFAAIIAVISLFPFYVLVLLACSSPSKNFSKGLYLTPNLYFSNFTEAWSTSRIGVAILNSLIITIGAVLLIIFLSSSAGYAIARFENKFNNGMFNILLLCMMVPGIINTVPLYTLMRKINGINSYWAMILVCATNALPFAVFLYKEFIKEIPKEMEEAAIVDGCTWFSAFYRITFPLLKPVTASVVIISGLSVWNNYAQAVFFLQDQSKQTIPIAISSFFQQYGAQWNLMAAAALMGLLPAVLTFIIFQNSFIKGIASGSIKG